MTVADVLAMVGIGVGILVFIWAIDRLGCMSDDDAFDDWRPA